MKRRRGKKKPGKTFRGNSQSVGSEKNAIKKAMINIL